MNLHTPLATKVAGGAVLLLLAALGWFVLVSPAWTAIGEAETARTDAAAANQLLTTQLADLRTQAGDLGRTTRSAVELAEIFPATADQPGFFADVNEAAQEAGIDVSAIDALSPGVPTLVVDPAADPAAPAASGDPAAGSTSEATATPATPATPGDAAGTADPTDSSAMAVQAVSLSVTATYPQLQQFLANLEGMQRALMISTLDVTRGEGDELTMSVEGATFVAPPLEAPGATGEDVGRDASSDPAVDPGAAGEQGRR